MDPIKILIVEDSILMREGLVSLFRTQPDFEVLGEAGSVREAITRCRELNPDLILMDFYLPDGTGIDATRAILSLKPDISIVFLTVHAEDENLLGAIRIGAKGYMLKNVPVNKLMESLRAVMRGEAAISRQMMIRIMEELSSNSSAGGTGQTNVLKSLSSRELDILHHLVNGSTNREIAAHLFISENTVKHHVRNILQKLNLHSRREIVEFARQHGFRDHRNSSYLNS